MAKATHQGTCQACGRLQMLPNGKLSKHGYDIRWGFFNGVCMGAGYIPFEEGFDLIEKTIKFATNKIEDLEKFRAELLAPATEETKAWHYVYRGDNRRHNRMPYVWEVVTLEVETKEWHPSAGLTGTYTNTHLLDKDGKRVTHNGEFNISNVAYIQKLNARRANALEPQIAELRRYIVWQQERVTSWKPGTLTPVTD